MTDLTIVWIALGVVAAASLWLGFKLGTSYEHWRLIEEAKVDFKKRFMQRFIEEYDKKVEERAMEIAMTAIKELEEKEKNKQ